MRTLTIATIAGIVSVFAASANAEPVPSFVIEKCGISDEVNLGDRTSEKFAHLPGVYVGRWENVLDSALVIQNVDDDGRVTAYYAWGRYTPWNISNSGCSLKSGTVSGDVVTFPGGRTITYRLRAPGEFRGTFDYGRGSNRGTFEMADDHPWQGNSGVVPTADTSANVSTVPGYVIATCNVEASTVLGRNTPDKFRHLSGVYVGKWADVLDSTLIVNDVNADGTVKALYVWNTYAGWNIDEPGCSTMEGTVRGNKIELSGRNLTITYTLRTETEFDAAYVRGGRITPGTFTKLESHPWTEQ